MSTEMSGLQHLEEDTKCARKLSVLAVFRKEIQCIQWSQVLILNTPKRPVEYWITSMEVSPWGLPRVSMALPCGAEGRLGRPAIDWQRKCRGKPWKAQKERRRQQPRPVTMVDAEDQKTSLGQWEGDVYYKGHGIPSDFFSRHRISMSETQQYLKPLAGQCPLGYKYRWAGLA